MEKERFFTLEMRIHIYELAYKCYLKSVKDRRNLGICLSLRNTIDDLIRCGEIKDASIDCNSVNVIPDIIDPYSSLEEYPELLKCKPSLTHNDVFWWNIEDVKSRINVFKKIMVKNNI